MARDTLQGLAVEVEGIKKDIANANAIHIQSAVGGGGGGTGGAANNIINNTGEP